MNWVQKRLVSWVSKSIGESFDEKSWLAWLGGGIPSQSGEVVNYETATRVTAVLACCRSIAEGVSQIPVGFYRESTDGSKEMLRGESLHKVLSRRPNEWMTSFEFRETLTYHALLARGGYAVINRVRGRVRELLPLLPHRVEPKMDKNYKLTYSVLMDDGSKMVFNKRDIFHIRGPSWDTFTGIDIISKAREAIGLSLAAEKSHARYHKNGTKLSGLISVDGSLKPEARDRLIDHFKASTTGDNSYKATILDMGAKFTPMTGKGDETQHLETRQFEVEEICRAFKVFPVMAGYSDKATTHASAEQMFLAHVVHTLGPWVERWEQSLDRDLLTASDLANGYLTKFNLQGLLRGDAKTRAEYYASGILNGWLVRNEARRMEDLNPIDGLDKPLVPLNMGSVDELTEAVSNELSSYRPDLDKKLISPLVLKALSYHLRGEAEKSQDVISQLLIP
jgi:HK97 family phage portal protein